MSPLRESLFLIRAASYLVPAIQRSEWRREWEAEVWYCSTRLPRRQLRELCWGSFSDAAWHRFHGSSRDHAIQWTREWSQSAAFCLLSILGIVIFLTLASGFLPRTRAIVMPLPYANADRIATVSQSGLSFSVRSGIPSDWVHLWQQKSKLIEDFAAYTWESATVVDASGEKIRILRARAGENFFSLLGLSPVAALEFHPGDVLLSYDFWRLHYGSKALIASSSLMVGGTRYRVAGVLPKGFWFLSPDIAVWSVLNADGENANARTGVVARLGPDVSKKMAQSELQSILYSAGFPLLDSIVDISPLQERVRSVLGSFALALALAMVITIAGLQLHIPAMDEINLKLDACRRSIQALFFCAKTSLLLAAVLIAGIEFTHAASITMTGGTDVLTEPLSTWLFLIGCMGVLSWSIYDQHRRCRVCLRRLGLATQVGCRGCMLLNWAGTEMVCIQGHGMLHVPEMTASWQESEQWTPLDDSWRELFVRDGTRA